MGVSLRMRIQATEIFILVREMPMYCVISLEYVLQMPETCYFVML